MKSIQIGSKRIGIGEDVFIVAELSGNHGGERDKALELLRAACETGADAVKLQVYRPDTMTLDVSHGDFAIPQDNAWAAYKDLYSLYEYAHTPWEWLPELFAIARDQGVEIFASVFDASSVDELEKYSVHAYKIAAPEIVDTALLVRVAKTRKPVLLSTGLSSLQDIDEAVTTLRDNGCDEIILLKCTTAYPAPPEEANLLTMKNMEEVFGCHSGFSDHSIGIGVPIAAVTLGARVIEKHIKLGDGDETVDSFFSLDSLAFKVMVAEIRRAEKSIGRVQYQLSPAAAKNRHGQRSLYISASTKRGEVFTVHNIQSVRPGLGLKPKYLAAILGRRAKVDLVKGDRVSWDVIE